MSDSIHLIRYTAKAFDGTVHTGIARVGPMTGQPTLADCALTMPGLIEAEYLGPEPRYLLRYRTDHGVCQLQLGSIGVGVAGQVVNQMVDREEAWGIEVLDEAGHDITSNFLVFRG